MTQVPTVNVFLSSEKKVLQEVLSTLGKKGGTPQSVIEKIDPNQRKGILLFNNYGNPNFISFEHSFNQPDTKATLKFIDPQNKFELNYLATGSIYRGLASVVVENRLGEVKKTEASTSAKESVLISPLDKQTLDFVKSKSLNKPIFIAYGVGNDVGSWSSVHKMTMTGLTFDPEGSREFTLNMIGGGGGLARIGNTGLFKQPIDFTAFGNTITCVGSSKRIRYEEAENGNTVYGSIASKYQPIDYHQLIIDVLVSYFRSSTNGSNIILLLPDLNQMLDNHLQQVKLDYSGKFTKEKFSKAKRLLIVTQNLLTSLGIEHYGVPRIKNADVIPMQAASMAAATKATPDQREDYVINSEWYARICASSTKGTPDLMAPIKKLLANINKFSTGIKMDVSYFTETDQRILDFWGSDENKNKYTFNGFNEFDPDKPTYVIGHIPAVSRLLYPKLENEDLFKTVEDRVLAAGPNDDISERDMASMDQRSVMRIARGSFFYKNTEELGSTYQKNIKELQRNVINQTTFGSKSLTPDTFGYTDNILSRDGINLIQNGGIPVFRHNTSEPNVLKIKLYDDTALYMSILRTGYKKQVDRVASQLDAEGKASVRINDYPIKTEEELIEAIKISRYSQFGSTVSEEEKVKQIVNQVDSSLANELSQKRGQQVDIAKLIKAVLNSLDGESLDIKIGQTVNANPAQLLTEMANSLGKQTTRIQLTCLPMFSLSTRTGAIMTPAVVFSQSIPMLDQRSRTRFDNFLTGVYAILGFKHTINSSNVQSEFVLARRNLSFLEEIEPADTGFEVGAGDYIEAKLTGTRDETPAYSEMRNMLDLPVATPGEAKKAREAREAESKEKTPEAVNIKVQEPTRQTASRPDAIEPHAMDNLGNSLSRNADEVTPTRELLGPGFYDPATLFRLGIISTTAGQPDSLWYPGDY